MSDNIFSDEDFDDYDDMEDTAAKRAQKKSAERRSSGKKKKKRVSFNRHIQNVSEKVFTVDEDQEVEKRFQTDFKGKIPQKGNKAI